MLRALDEPDRRERLPESPAAASLARPAVPTGAAYAVGAAARAAVWLRHRPDLRRAGVPGAALARHGDQAVGARAGDGFVGCGRGRAVAGDGAFGARRGAGHHRLGAAARLR